MQRAEMIFAAVVCPRKVDIIGNINGCTVRSPEGVWTEKCVVHETKGRRTHRHASPNIVNKTRSRYGNGIAIR